CNFRISCVQLAPFSSLLTLANSRGNPSSVIAAAAAGVCLQPSCIGKVHFAVSSLLRSAQNASVAYCEEHRRAVQRQPIRA
ncbi:unnamed protein product, partial [Hermetia illucens]